MIVNVSIETYKKVQTINDEDIVEIHFKMEKIGFLKKKNQPKKENKLVEKAQK